jgi:4-aminobutyrate aminotransferase-like enzyme
MGSMFRDALAPLAARRPYLGSPRGKGLMLGLPVMDDAGHPDGPRCDQYLEDLKDCGVLAGKTGPDRNVLTFMPPLIIQQSQLSVVLEALEAVVT